MPKEHASLKRRLIIGKKIEMMSSCRSSESEIERAEHFAANQQRETDRRASESDAERARCLAANRQRVANYRASESENESTEHLAANQQREANRRAFESEAQHTHRLPAGQQREANRRASESEAEGAQQLADGQQRETNRRTTKSDVQQEHCPIECVLLQTGQILVLEKGSNKGRMILLMQPGKGVQLGNVPLAAVDEFRQSIYDGSINPCYCCTRLCYNNGRSFIDLSDPLLLPIHDRELSESGQDTVQTSHNLKDARVRHACHINALTTHALNEMRANAVSTRVYVQSFHACTNSSFVHAYTHSPMRACMQYQYNNI